MGTEDQAAGHPNKQRRPRTATREVESNPGRLGSISGRADGLRQMCWLTGQV